MARRILHITSSLERRDIPKQVLNLSGGLLHAGFDVHVASLSSGGKLAREFRDNGIVVHELGRRWLYDPIAAARFHRLLRSLQPDVVHAWDFASRIHTALASKTGSIRLFVAGYYQLDPWKSPATWSAERFAAACATRRVTDGAHLRTWCSRHGLAAEKFVIIPPGTPAPRPSDVSRNALLDELRLPSDARLVGAIGPLVPEECVKHLIWAADLLRVLHNNLRLLVIGDGPMRVSLQQYARLASDLEHIQFLNDRDDVWRILPHLDVLWNASESRSHSMPVLEAMAAGVPVVASDTPLNRDLIIEGESGYLISMLERSGRADRARCTDRLFNDTELATRIGQSARIRADQAFSLQRYVQQHIDVYAAAWT